MMGWNRGIGLAMGLFAFALAAPAGAQENLDSGKSGAQLFASDCAICHKRPQGLAKAGGLFGLSSFLREHYTASRESAAVIAGYLESFGKEPAPAKRVGMAKRKAKGDEKGKPEEKKGKPANAKTSGPKSSEPKSESKTDPKTEPKAESKSETKSETKSESKPSEPKSGEPKADAAPAAKPDKPAKSD
jgi:hypothetical protein